MARVELEWINDRQLVLVAGPDRYIAERVPETINDVRVKDPGWRLYLFTYHQHRQGKAIRRTTVQTPRRRKVGTYTDLETLLRHFRY